MCTTTLTEFTPSICFSRDVEVDIDPTALARELESRIKMSDDINDPRAADSYLKILGDALCAVAEPKVPTGSEYVCWMPLETLTDVLASAHQ